MIAADRSITTDPADLSQDRIKVAVRASRGILMAALLCYLGVTVLNILSAQPSPPALSLGLSALPVVFLLQLLHSAPAGGERPLRLRILGLAGQGILSYAPLIWFGVDWGAMAGFFAASLLLLLPRRVGWSLYALVTLSMAATGYLHHLDVVDTVYMAESTALTGLVVYGLSRLVSQVVQLHRARLDLARLAVANEQLRFSRDLHDLLGYSLSAITLKNELINRLIPINPARASQEVGEVLVISRQALADVRRVASGYRSMSLTAEVASAKSVLTSAGVAAQVELDEEVNSLDPAVATVIATVVREGVTNLLRHTEAQNCRITARVSDGVVRVVMINDGLVAGYRDTSPHSGSGLSNLRRRLEGLGGRLVVETQRQNGPGGDRFQLVAEAPGDPPTAPHRGAAESSAVEPLSP
jgi:two-component system sensor histidine kinase DesK